MRAFFEAIQSLFVDFLFKPLDGLRALELKTWFGANTINWIFMFICAYFMIYWIKQIKITKENDGQDTTAHSFLK
ncbi:DUF6341 family protein [Flavobacterium silvaticum]|uniref:Uracil phosphoribosyltransferase n=1 Tax=Flavobacterium silvaticum TaxID=1852020 RepID=A0A972FLQ6_9FLAO|nr:uracil phosphoribosyltransferase [Flavobacterium silvaticum]NMH28374.1 uracil phosphoribosyltransferase [Flavobacterium silvaticum]